MATLERRVQVLFDPARYAALEDLAATERMSVGALIRQAVDERLDRVRKTKREALGALLAIAEAHPSPGPIDWDAEKELFEREFPDVP